MLYVTYEDSVVHAIGIRKKMQAQYRVFKKAFGEAYYTLYRGQMMHLYRENILLEKELAFTKGECNTVIKDWIERYNISKVYVRHYSADRQELLFYQYLNEKDIRVAVEFPTVFPAYQGIIDSKVVTAEDTYYKNRMHEYVRCCTAYQPMEKVYGIPCIPLVNGVDIDEQPQKKSRKADGRIVLLVVATYTKWHGHERVIEGMHRYYADGGKREIIFNIVGSGGQLNYYESLVEEYRLQGHVNFCGVLSGEKLDEIYDASDIAIGDLGIYKVGLKSGAPIKEREYCARGIPFIYGHDDMSFGKDNYYARQVSNDETPIDMQMVINFYNEMYDGREFAKDMRQYALLNLTWNKILQPVIDYYLC